MDQDRSSANLRASDAEREATMDRLRHAAGEGRLTLEELVDRLEVTDGTVSRGDLDAVTHDLPHARQAPETRDSGQLKLAIFDDVRRSGHWMVPARSRWLTVFGDVVLDLREAQVSGDRVEIEARSLFGDFDLRVPEGVAVEMRAQTPFGHVRQRAGSDPPPGAPLIVLTGATVFGSIRVRAQRLRERLLAGLRPS